MGERNSITWAACQLSTAGDGATDHLAANILYEEFRRLARPAMNDEATRNGLRTTDVVHQAFERLFLRPRALGKQTHWPNRLVFYTAAAKTISDILVDEARHRLAQKRGGGWRGLSLEDVGDPFATPPDLLLEMQGELQRLGLFNSRAARVVELRFFAGLAIDEIADLMEIAPRTVRRDWDLARLWLYRRLHDPDEPSSRGGGEPQSGGDDAP